MRSLSHATLVVSCLLAAGCVGTGSGPGSEAGDRGAGSEARLEDARSGDRDLVPPPGDGTRRDATVDTSSGPAYLHADLWSTFWNDRTRCGAERTFLEICQRRKQPDCSLYQSALAACDPAKVVYGQVGPEKQGEPLCNRGKLPAIGGCDASKYDFDALRFYWYGAEWQGNWPVATIKVFKAGADWTKGGELVALSNLPGRAEAAMSGIANHGLGHGCAIPGATSGDAAYRTPFGAFAWIELPPSTPLTIASLAACNFGNQPFAGCNRGAATQSPWVTSPPGATLGCVHLVENVVLEPGRHYHLRYGKLEELLAPGPPQTILDGFALPEVKRDVSTSSACTL